MRRPGVLIVFALLAPALAGASGESAAAGPPNAEPAVGQAHESHDHGDHDHGGHDHAAPDGHAADEGLMLRPAGDAETVASSGGRCDKDAPVRRYDIAATAIDITLNRYGDHDPAGRMYALLEQVEEIAAVAERGSDAVSTGLQGDEIQPLVLRATPGECLRVRLTNQLVDEPASFHLHASSLVVSATGAPAVESEPTALAAPGATVAYEWSIPEDEPEATHVFHSHGDARIQSGHGLFGTLVVEPAGSTWRDPRTGSVGTVGWDAIVTPGDGAPFREFVLAYHEIGSEDFRITRADGSLLPLVDPITLAYRPGARAINYRSEPFYNRLSLQRDRFGTADESLAYSSYAFGDPATPILRSYLGEPVKERVVHAGAEVFHVHHVHGGSVRWRRQPGAGPTGRTAGLDKHPAIEPGASERTDSQTIGPSEAFDVDHECGAGGCQQGAGDYLVHCHVAHHYFAGMWGIWRVYNTAQDGAASTDALPKFSPLAAVEVEPAVDSSELDAAEVARARRHLPTPGRPDAGDASVWDWVEEGGRILGEPETTEAWPGYTPTDPGTRRPVLFDPATGAPAYPLLRPHLGVRPPFAPAHGPAPFLDPPDINGHPPPPGANGPASLCPAGTEVREFVVRAIELPVPINARHRIVDPAGMLFVLGEDEARVRADPAARQPLAIRANAGEHCVDVLLTNEIPDDANHPFSKISLHIHHVQFDVQGSDGVDTGFSFEQTLRPFHANGGRLRRPARRGAGDVAVDRAIGVPVGAFVAIGVDDGVPEVRRVIDDLAGKLVLDRPLERDHPVGEWVTTEFLRIRWYPDVQVGTSYFHDHVNGIKTWQHGLVGALVVEPPGATYHDPHTGADLRNGAIADIHVPATRPVSVDVRGSFRELVSFIQDGSPLTNVGRSAGANLNLRAEPLARRRGPPDQAFSSTVHGDPATPLLHAYVGDPVVVRATVGGTNEVHTWHLDGHWFRREPWSATSAPTSTAHIGISERMDLVVPAAGGPQRRAGDYLYADGRALKLREGAWGLLRVLRPGTVAGALRALPGHRAAASPEPPVCPAKAPRKSFDVVAVETRLPMLGSVPGRAFVPADEVDAVLAAKQAPTPLVLRAAIGDCVVVNLENRLPAGSAPVSVHADGLAYDPLTSGGVEAGRNPSQVVSRGDTRRYTFFAHPEYGEGAALLRDGGDLSASGQLGMYGAVVIGPARTTYRPKTGWQSVATDDEGHSWRDVALLLHDEDDAIGTHRMPYTTAVRGAVAVNYGRGDTAPIAEAYAGDPVRVHVLAPWSEQVQVFTFEGHRWPVEPGMPGSTRVESLAIGGLESVMVIPDGGAGGTAQLPGEYRWGDHREPYREAGLWGRFLVHDGCAGRVDSVPPLGDHAGCSTDDSDAWLIWAVATVGLLALALGAVLEVRRRKRLLPVRPFD